MFQAVFDSKIAELTSGGGISSQQNPTSTISGLPKVKRIIDSDEE